jgi:septal ring factor EnvC (AmiA/AmiB activator)
MTTLPPDQQPFYQPFSKDPGQPPQYPGQPPQYGMMPVPPVLQSEKKRFWSRSKIAVLLVGILVAGGLGFLTSNDITAHNNLSTANHNLAVTKANLTKAEGSIESLQSQLSNTKSSLESAQQSVTNLQGQLSTTEDELSTAQNQLSNTQGALNASQSEVQDLNTCLTGVLQAAQDANNGDYTDAVTTLQSVYSVCISARQNV